MRKSGFLALIKLATVYLISSSLEQPWGHIWFQLINYPKKFKTRSSKPEGFRLFYLMSIMVMDQIMLRRRQLLQWNLSPVSASLRLQSKYEIKSSLVLLKYVGWILRGEQFGYSHIF